jgi:hypothetical protein
MTYLIIIFFINFCHSIFEPLIICTKVSRTQFSMVIVITRLLNFGVWTHLNNLYINVYIHIYDKMNEVKDISPKLFNYVSKCCKKEYFKFRFTTFSKSVSYT